MAADDTSRWSGLLRAFRVATFVGGGVALCYAAPAASPSSQARAVLRPGADATAAPYWHVKGEAWGRPAADATTAYFLSKDRRLLALEAGTGRIRWQRDTGARGSQPSGWRVETAGSNVIVGDDAVLAFDRATGSPRWRFVPPDGYGAGDYLGTIVRNRVYTGSPVGRVYAIDTETGLALWTAIVSDDKQTLVFEPVADEDLVVSGYSAATIPNSGGVVALDAATGVERWRMAFPRPANGALGSSSAGNPLLVDDLVIAASGYGVIYAFDRATGAVRWSLPRVEGLPSDYLISADFDFRPLTRTGRTLFAGSLTGYLLAYSLDTRRELWRYAGTSYVSIAFNISSDDRSVYVPYLGGRLVALDVANGSERWHTGEQAGAFSFPVRPATDRLYVASSASGFYALRR